MTDQINQLHHRRQLAAAEVEQTLEMLADQYGTSLTHIVWHLQDAPDRNGPHWLDVAIDEFDTRIFFNDDELLAYLNQHDDVDIDTRLRYIVMDALYLKKAKLDGDSYLMPLQPEANQPSRNQWQ